MGSNQALRSRLAAGAAELGVPLPAIAQDRLLAFQGLLQKWNRIYNLTAMRDPRQMLVKHLLDSLAVVPFLQGARLLDVGSGAGLPGIVIAIARPDLHCTLLDRQGKKTRFLTQAVIELQLRNVEVVHARVEDFRPEAGFDCIISRAFSELTTFIGAAAPLLAKGGVFLAMKSAGSDEEVAALPTNWNVRVHELAVPGLDAVRRLLELRTIH